MKKFALKSVAAILFVSFSLTSCSNDDGGETVIIQNEFVTAATAPETGVVNQDITIDLKYMADNACGQFNKFVETTNGNTKIIEVQVKYVGTDCGENPSEVALPYTFKVNQPGTYTFKFKRNASQYLTRVVTVE